MDQVNAMGHQLKPQLSDIITPGGPAMRVMATGAFQAAKKGIGEGISEAQEAGQNIAAGEPVLPNVGKAAYGGLHAALQSLSPAGGSTVEHAGEDIAARNYWGAAGGLTGIISQMGLMKAASGMPKKPTTIAGVEFPETMGQLHGAPGGLGQTLEHYTSGTFLGGPLKEIAAGQQEAARQVLANLARQPGTPEMLSGNWGVAAKQTRAAANPLYQSLSTLDASNVTPVAQGILADEDVAPLLNASTRRALNATMGGSNPVIEATAKNLGYKGSAEAISVLGKDEWNRWLPKDLQTASSGATVGDAMKARSELADIVRRTTDRGDKRLLMGSLSDLDKSINSSLSPEQLAARQRADILTRRAYIMDRAQKSLAGIESMQTPGRAPVILSSRFNRMVNDLVRSRDIDVLFPDPSDRQAMSQLAQFMSEKNSTLKGQAGVAEGIARVGMALEAARIPSLAFKGAFKAAGNIAGTLAGYKMLVNLMANPGGAKDVLSFLQMSAPSSAAVMRSSQHIMEQAKNGEIPPGEETRLGAPTKVNVPYWKAKTYPDIGKEE